MSVMQGLSIAPKGFGKHLIAAWKGESGDDRLFYSLFDGGQWDTPATIPGYSSVGPALATVGHHTHAAWKGGQDDERLFHSVFDGAAWGEPRIIPGHSSVGLALTDFKGRLFAAWKGESFDQRLFFSTYDGWNWAPPRPIVSVSSAVGPSIAQFGSLLYAVWRGRDDDQSLYWATYDETSWSPQSPIPDAASDIGPSLAVFDGKLYAMWKGPKGDQGLYWSNFDGAIWSSRQQVDGVGSSIGPAIAGARHGPLYALWKGVSGDQRLWFSNFDGSSWAAQVPIPGNTGQDPIRFIWIPDVHLERANVAPGSYYPNGVDRCTPPSNPVGDQPNTWIKQCQWIRNNQPNHRYQAVLCAGDYAAMDGGSWDLPAKQQEAWSEGLCVVAQCGKPYLSVAGNHDNESNTPGWYTYSFDQNIGHERIKNNLWYLEHWNADPLQNANPGSSNPELPNHYRSKSSQAVAFGVGALQVLVISLELYPRPNALAWATGVIANHPSHDVIVVTHAYIYMDGSPYDADSMNLNENQGALKAPTAPLCCRGS